MNLEHLLQAGLQLEKRIATDRALRRCFSELWKEADKKRGKAQASSPDTADHVDLRLQIPAELHRRLIEAAERTGKTPSQIICECLALYGRPVTEASRESLPQAGNAWNEER